MDRARRLLALIAACRGKRVVVFGDLIADEFVYGRVARVSREAPVLILEYDATESCLAAPATPPTTSPASAASVHAGVAGRPRRAGPPAVQGAAARRRARRAWRVPAVIARRSRPAFSPAAFTRPSNRSCASIGSPASRCPKRIAPPPSAPPCARSRTPTPCWSPITARDW